jgi:hypothetical protein
MAKPTIVEILRDAWAEYQKHGVDKHGLEFGRKLFELRKDSEVVQGGTSLSKSLGEAGIPHSTAYYWLERWALSNGWRKLNKEKRNHRSDGPPFEVTKNAAFEILNEGFKLRNSAEPEKELLFRSAKDWARARLNSPLGTPSEGELKEGMIVTLNGVRYKVLAEPVLNNDMGNPHGLPMIQLTVEDVPFTKVKKVTTGSEAAVTAKTHMLNTPTSKITRCTKDASKVSITPDGLAPARCACVAPSMNTCLRR